MLKGSILFFSSLLSVIFLRRRLRCHNWIGLAVSCTALALVGLSSVWSREDKAEQGSRVCTLAMHLVGIGLIIIGQVVCATQYVVEEHLLKPPNTAAPLVLVGLEGVWGSLVMICAILPLFQFLPGNDVDNRYENTLDTLVKVENSPLLIWFMIVAFFAVLIYNIVGIMITAESSCIHHTFLDAMRTILIWAASIVAFYVFDPAYGEAWTVYGWLQLCGFALLVLGQMIYDEIVQIPMLRYDDDDFYANQKALLNPISTSQEGYRQL